MRNKRKRQIFIAVIALILIAMMVASLLVAVVYADTGSAPLEAVAISADSSGNGAVSTDGGSGTGTERTTANSADNLSESVRSGSGAGSSSTPAAENSDKEKAGVYIENINVSGMTEQEISTAVSQKMKSLQNDIIVLYAGGNSVRVRAGDLGLDYSNKSVVGQAYSVCRRGNIFKRFRADRELSSDRPIVLELALTVDPAKVRSVISDRSSALNCEASQCGLKLEKDNTFRLTKGRDGVSVRVEPSVTRVVSYMESEWHGGEGGVTLAADITPYSNSAADLSKVRDLLGSGTTGYQTGNTNHDTNVEIAAQHIDGTVLYPGEEFSAEKVIGPTTEEYGFLPGDTYEGDEVVQTYGGGVCQTSSTLYNAVLQAELEVTERHNHSFLVSYVEPGFDAAIAEGLLDFKFKNNTDAPIYIQAITQNGYLTFNIYGHETRDRNRTVRYYTETSDPVDVETAYETDANEPLGSISVSGGVAGITATLYKQVYTDGALDSEEVVSQSIYQMMPQTYKVGTENADAQTLASVNAAVATQDLAQIQAAVGNGSVVQTEVMEN